MTDCGHQHRDSRCISVDSWWADINYYLSVLPFLVAVDSGVLGNSSDQITILPPPKDKMKFCYDVSGCQSAFPETMNSLRTFFQYMKLPSSDFDDLLKYLWAAHTVSLQDSISAFVDRYAYYSDQEANFEKNWAIAVEYLDAARFPTTLKKTHSFEKGLPPRILHDDDIAPFIADFTLLQNSVLVSLKGLGGIHRYTESSFLSSWKSIMSKNLARKLFLKASEMIVDIFP